MINQFKESYKKWLIDNDINGRLPSAVDYDKLFVYMSKLPDDSNEWYDAMADVEEELYGHIIPF